MAIHTTHEDHGTPSPDHDTTPTDPHAGHDMGGHDMGEHAAMGHGGGHGDHVGMFRRRFWWSLLLTLPVVVTSHMIMDGSATTSTSPA
jgi:P-type Cu2+ transporter